MAGIRWPFRLRRARSLPRGGSLTIFCFHGIVSAPLPVADFCFVPVPLFRRQIEAIARGHRVLPLGDAVPALRAGRLPVRSAVLTFDDGLQSQHDLALPVLARAGLPATCFVTTSTLGTDDTFWFCRLHRAVSETRRDALEWQGVRFGLGDARQRAAASHALQARVKSLAPPDIEAAVDGIAAALGVAPRSPVAADSPYRCLDLDAARAMLGGGVFTFGAHAHHHAILARLAPEAQREEIETSLGRVRALGLGACDAFAYPNGRAQDFDAYTLELLRAGGVRYAVTAVAAPCMPDGDPLTLPRTCVGPDTAAESLA